MKQITFSELEKSWMPALDKLKQFYPRMQDFSCMTFYVSKYQILYMNDCRTNENMYWFDGEGLEDDYWYEHPFSIEVDE